MLSFHTKKLVYLGLIVGFVGLFLLDFFGIIWHNEPFAAFYTVKGLDVSHHQGNIDWQKVAAKKKYTFVFIKATEGNDFVDDNFSQNWKEAKQNGMLVGAYHFFSLRSSGAEQAKLFISTVPVENPVLPPVIDIEIDVNQDAEKVRGELAELIRLLEMNYKKKPILYVTDNTYDAYIQGHFSAYHVWIRDVFKPVLLRDRKWFVWQYSNRGRVDGIDTYVDLNVFRGSKEDLVKLTESQLP